MYHWGDRRAAGPPLNFEAHRTRGEGERDRQRRNFEEEQDNETGPGGRPADDRGGTHHAAPAEEVRRGSPVALCRRCTGGEGDAVSTASLSAGRGRGLYRAGHRR